MKLEPIFNQILVEATLSRVWRHINNNETFGIISAFRNDYGLDENNSFHENLKKDVRDMKYGFMELRGGYTYINNKGKEVSIEEESLFVPKITFDNIIKLANKYEQETVIFKDSEQFILVRPDGNIEKTFLKGEGYNFKLENLKNAWSQFIKSKNKNAIKKFTFNVQEIIIPSRTDSYKMLGENKGLARVKYINLF